MFPESLLQSASWHLSWCIPEEEQELTVSLADDVVGAVDLSLGEEE